MTLAVRELSSPGAGAVSVVSVRGGGALEHVRARFDRPHLAVGRPQLTRLAHAGTELDEALVCALADDDVEIHLHGSPVLVRALLAVLDTRPPPAPTSCEARALALVPEAASESGARILLDQSGGAWRHFVESLASARDPRKLLTEVEQGSRAARFALGAPRVVLAGDVNAGKSTLFNALVGSARAITSPEPGTTRDLVRARGRIGRYVVEFVDTAGARELTAGGEQSEIERAGMERALAARSGADLVLWLVADERSRPAPLGAFAVYTQDDLRAWRLAPAISALRDSLRARDVVARLVHEALSLPPEPWTSAAPRAFDAESRATLAQFISIGSDAGVRTHAALVLTRASF